MSEWMMAAILVFAVLAAVFAGLSWWAQKRREHDGVELENRLEKRIGELGEELEKSRQEVGHLRGGLEQMDKHMGRLTDESRNSADKIRDGMQDSLQKFGASGENSMNTLRNSVDAKLTETVKEVGEIRDKTLESLDSVRRDTESNLGKLRESVESRLEGMGRKIDTGLQEARESSEKKLDQIRDTVDEKLQTTLEQRLGERFRAVSAQLESVHKGLGEMQTLASKVGDLQRVLTSTPARGAWGEQTLKSIIREFLTPEQYVENAQIDPAGGEKVEFAIRVPVEGVLSLLPVDSKFPTADYECLVQAEERGDKAGAASHRKGVLRAIRTSAGNIGAKYIRPPHSTDFAFLFLPTEGLYAVAASEPGFMEEIRQTHKVMIAGPSNFAFFLSAVRMGFQLFAAGQNAHEVSKILGAVKTEFGKFGKVLTGIRRNLDSAAKKIDHTEVRVRAMRRTLQEVEGLPEEEIAGILGADPLAENEDE